MDTIYDQGFEQTLYRTPVTYGAGGFTSIYSTVQSIDGEQLYNRSIRTSKLYGTNFDITPTGTISLTASSGKAMTIGGSPMNINSESDDIVFSAGGGNVRPLNDNDTDLGHLSQRWQDVYASNGTIQTSDEREKTNILESDLGLDFIRGLRPVSFVRRGHKRPHYGFLAQQIKEVLGEKDFGGYIHDPESDTYGLRYEELIAPLVKAVQELSMRVIQLENLIKP